MTAIQRFITTARYRPGPIGSATFCTSLRKFTRRELLVIMRTAGQEVLFPISWAVVDYDEYYEQLDQRMRSAGIDRVVAEYQRQLDEWMADQ